jgi:filamentous hemagglutinin
LTLGDLTEADLQSASLTSLQSTAKNTLGMATGSTIDALAEMESTIGDLPKGYQGGPGAQWIGEDLSVAPESEGTFGSGPYSTALGRGFLEVSDRYPSSAAVNNFSSPNPTDFVFDPVSQRFGMGNNALGHDGILDAMGISDRSQVVGGTTWRAENGILNTNEWSGHYGTNWNDSRRTQFQDFMQQNNVDITHTPWNGRN